MSSGMCSSTSDGDDRVEALVGERQRRGVATQHADDVLVLDLAGLGHRRQRRLRRGHLVGGVVDGHGAVAAAGQLEGVPPEPGAGVEHEAPGWNAELGRACRSER